MNGKLSRRILEWYASKYDGRPADALAVHEIIRGYWALAWRRPGRTLNGVFLRGELIEEGLARILNARTPERVTAELIASWPVPEVEAALEAAGVPIKPKHGGAVVRVTGATDLELEDGTLIEVKTTRHRNRPPSFAEWLAQAAVYAELYNRPVTLLIVHTDGSEPLEEYVVEPCRRGLYVAELLDAFMRGLAPVKAVGVPMECVEGE